MGRVFLTLPFLILKFQNEYYIYDGKVINGRMRVTNSASRVGRKPVGDNVTGFVKKSEMG